MFDATCGGFLVVSPCRLGPFRTRWDEQLVNQKQDPFPARSSERRRWKGPSRPVGSDHEETGCARDRKRRSGRGVELKHQNDHGVEKGSWQFGSNVAA